MFGLLITPCPEPGESFYGYLYRTGDANGLTGLEVIDLLRRSFAAGQAEWKQIHFPPSWSLLVEELITPTTDAIRCWSLRYRKCCTQCLSQSPHWREVWDLTLATCCSTHECCLRDHCSACGVRFKADVMARLECTECGASLLQDAAPVRADPMGIWLTSEFEHRLRGTAGRSPSLAHLTLSEFHELAKRFGVRASHSLIPKPLKLSGAGDLIVAAPLAEAAGRVLSNWPLGFHSFLKGVTLEADAASIWKLGSVFGSTYTDIHEGLNGSSFDFVRNAFNSFIQSLWEAPLAKRNRRLPLGTIVDHRWVPIPKAAQRLGIKRALLRRMVSAGELSHHSKEFVSGRTGVVVDFLQLTDRRGQLINAISLEEAADILKITEYRVRQLLDAGLLQYFGGTPPQGGRWWIDHMSVTNLAIPIPCPGFTDGLVSIAYLAKHELSAEGGLVELIASIQHGKVRAYFAAQEDQFALGRWLVDRDSFARTHQIRSSLSVAEAASLLGVKQEVAYALVRSGLLASYSALSGRVIARFVSMEAIETFNCSYAFGSELAKAARTSPKSVVADMTGRGISPVAGPGISGAECRHYVWPRSVCQLR